MQSAQLSTKELLTNQIVKPITTYLHPFSLICEHIGILRKEACISFVAKKINFELSDDRVATTTARRTLLSSMLDTTGDLLASIPERSVLLELTCENDREHKVRESLIKIRTLLAKIQCHYTTILDTNSLTTPSQATLNRLHFEAFCEIMALNDAIFNLEMQKMV